MNLPELPTSYSLQAFEADTKAMQPRAFDIWILPVFLVGFAVVSKKPIKRTARRMLCAAGLYMAVRNYSLYKKAITDAIPQ